jgi:hypothetical protein
VHFGAKLFFSFNFRVEMLSFLVGAIWAVFPHTDKVFTVHVMKAYREE